MEQEHPPKQQAPRPEGRVETTETDPEWGSIKGDHLWGDHVRGYLSLTSTMNACFRTGVLLLYWWTPESTIT